ncbi:RteC domain-containing protein [Myroides odoratimimus]|uniref:RteC domain-containing protein n=1 Tax=Myroides odoratimimus TaxID=76832 RepID=UPI002578CD7E|nr:RteC domain-containing protein [Myroides odoratimimus]MDM1461746.1 RteC domain-containing protein [Myroides odoratimimus]
MTLNTQHKSVLKQIESKEIELNLIDSSSISKAYEMIQFLRLLLIKLKEEILLVGFSNQTDEIHFFKEVKPQVLGKLIFYNKVYKIETNCPIDLIIKNKYYHKHLEELNLEYKKYFAHNEFYRYYNANRIDKDIEYFTLGKTDLLIGINSFIFEIDSLFSTYYDYKIARIIAHDLLQNYLHENIQEYDIGNNHISSPNLVWSESQNALIELIYALYLSGSINNGKGEIRKIALLFQELFGIKLLDIHHAFHRMKTRAKSKTCYLDKLKEVLEKYMNNET